MQVHGHCGHHSVDPADDAHAPVYFIDIEMNSPDQPDYPLFELENIVPTG